MGKDGRRKEEQEAEILNRIHNRLGLGASISKEGEIKRQKQNTDDFIRKQLLGRDYKKSQSNRAIDGTKLGFDVGHVGVKPRPAPVKRPVDESDDEGGRSSLGRSKRQKPGKELRSGTLEAAGTKVEAGHPNASTASQSRKKSSNYLDEVLANKSHRKSKKNRKKKGQNMVPIAAE